MDAQTLLAAAPLGVLSVMLALFTLRDLIRRPSESVLGPKLFWAMMHLVPTLGPVLYVWMGRREPRSFDD